MECSERICSSYWLDCILWHTSLRGTGLVSWIQVGVAAVLLLASACTHALSGVALESVLIQEGDLPAGLAAGPISDVESDLFKTEQWKRKEIHTAAGQSVGSVSVLLFRSRTEQDRAFDFYSLMETREGIVPYEIPVGEYMVGASEKGRLLITFVRCGAVAHIWLNAAKVDVDYETGIGEYAKVLDERLAALVCE